MVDNRLVPEVRGSSPGEGGTVYTQVEEVRLLQTDTSSQLLRTDYVKFGECGWQRGTTPGWSDWGGGGGVTVLQTLTGGSKWR